MVSKHSYPYPPDEFDHVAADSRPKEVHAAKRSAWSRIWPFIVVVVVVPAVAFGVMRYLAHFDAGSGDNAAPATSPTTTLTATATVTDLPPVPPDAETTTPEEPTTPAAPETKEPPPLDRTVGVDVLNAKGEAGLAGEVKRVLDEDGWSAVAAADYEGDQRDGVTTVYYGKNALSTSAQTAADLLHIDAVEKDKTVAPSGIVVVLRSDYVR
jgi:hypothetical protein